MKFLWQSNAPWAGTGYGQQTRLVLKALLDRGHEPTCFAFYGLHGGGLEYDGYPVLPGSNYDTWGNDVIRAHIARSGAQVACTLIDVFVLDLAQWAHLDVPWLGWVPIDSEGMSLQAAERVKTMDYPIAMSQFGANQMLEMGVEPAITIPHALNPVYKPMESEWRKVTGIPEDAFLVGMVMANKGDRKQYPAQLEAVKRFKDKHPDLDVQVYIHADSTQDMGGWDLKQVVDKVGLQGYVSVTNRYDAAVVAAGPELMAQMYNSFDVVMNVSSGEGFGVPIIEAQACGTPVITGNWTSMPELTYYGYTVEPDSRVLGAHFGYQYIPSVEDMAYRLECVWRMASKAKSLEAATWAHDNFNIDYVASLWEFALNAAQELAKKTAPSVRRPTPILTQEIKRARQAMDAERHEYGTPRHRLPEYIAIREELLKYGLQDGDRVLDLGAADCDLDHYLRSTGWQGVYCPVDMIIDGTDLNDYEIPNGFDFIVLEQVIEHLHEWRDLLERCEGTGAVVVVATPNGNVVPHEDKHDLHDQMAHVDWITPDDLIAMGYEVTLKEFTAKGPGDTIIASKWNGVSTNGDGQREPVEVAAGGPEG